MNKLNLGSGANIREGYINLDLIRQEGVNITHDLNHFPWPLKSNFFDEVYCSHILEHLNDLPKAMEEIHRICKPKARIEIISPYFSGPGSFNDPTHKQFITYLTFDYFARGANAKYIVIKKRIYYLSAKKYFKSKWFSFPLDMLINLFPKIYQRLFCWILPSSEIHFLLLVDK